MEWKLCFSVERVNEDCRLRDLLLQGKELTRRQLVRIPKANAKGTHAHGPERGQLEVLARLLPARNLLGIQVSKGVGEEVQLRFRLRDSSSGKAVAPNAFALTVFDFDGGSDERIQEWLYIGKDQYDDFSLSPGSDITADTSGAISSFRNQGANVPNPRGDPMELTDECALAGRTGAARMD